MRPRSVIPFTLLLCFGLMLAATASQAQTLIFNVPSPDIVDPGHMTVARADFLRPWRTSSGPQEFTVVQNVLGIGHDVEVGANVGPFDYRYLSQSVPFLDATLKWRPWKSTIGTGHGVGTLGLVAGDNMGIGLAREVSGHFRNFLYATAYLDVFLTGTRISAGPYYATRDVFGDYARAGAQLTFEQPIALVPGLMLAADWYSGRNGSFTPGLLYAKDPWSFGFGYGFSNNGRKDDLVTLIATMKF